MVYVPEHFEEKDQKEIQKIIDNFPLATLIAFGSKGLSANHLPFIVDYNKHGSTTLLGHIALENQLFKENKNNDEVLVLYKAEDTYVSPNWYPTKKKTHKVVPTWNYQSVHFYGRIFFFQDLKSLLGIVGRLTKIHENIIGEKKPWSIKDAPKEFIKQKLSSIVGVKIEVTKVVAKSKLSQNKEIDDFNGVKKKMLQKDKHSLYEAMKNINLDRE